MLLTHQFVPTSLHPSPPSILPSDVSEYVRKLKRRCWKLTDLLMMFLILPTFPRSDVKSQRPNIRCVLFSIHIDLVLCLTRIAFWDHLRESGPHDKLALMSIQYLLSRSYGDHRSRALQIAETTYLLYALEPSPVSFHRDSIVDDASASQAKRSVAHAAGVNAIAIDKFEGR